MTLDRYDNKYTCHFIDRTLDIHVNRHVLSRNGHGREFLGVWSAKFAKPVFMKGIDSYEITSNRNQILR